MFSRNLPGSGTRRPDAQTRSVDRHRQPATHLANPRAARLGVHPGIPAKQRQTNPPDLDAELYTEVGGHGGLDVGGKGGQRRVKRAPKRPTRRGLPASRWVPSWLGSARGLCPMDCVYGLDFVSQPRSDVAAVGGTRRRRIPREGGRACCTCWWESATAGGKVSTPATTRTPTKRAPLSAAERLDGMSNPR